MSDQVETCIKDLQAKLKAVYGMTNSVTVVYTEDELIELCSSKQGEGKTIIGIVYEGMRPMKESGATRTGISCELFCTILMMDKAVSGATEAKLKSINMLAGLRTAIHGSKSPTGHKWTFGLESAANIKKGQLIWMQRWVTTIQITPQNL
jgi:hypothetical protein